MKIHQNVSELIYDQLTDSVIDEYANKVAKNMMKYVIICDQDRAGYDTLLLTLDIYNDYEL